MKILDKEFELFLEEKEIQRRVTGMAFDVSFDFKGKDPLLIPILNGSFIFAADLIRRLDITCECTFIKAQSYDALKSKGEVDIKIGLDKQIEGRHIIIVEDIVDTGHTMNRLFQLLDGRGAASISICTLFHKPDSFQYDFPLQYVGFEVPNIFIIGYGLDYNGFGRGFRDVWQVI